MRKIPAVALSVLVVCNLIMPVFGEEPAAADQPAVTEETSEPEAMGNPLTKFGRGLCNMVTFQFEIFHQSRRVKAEYGSPAGMTYGILKGLFMAGVRAGVGVYETATFFIPYPAGYKPILTDPVSFFPRPPKKLR